MNSIESRSNNNSALDQQNSVRTRINDLKKGSVTYAEYKEHCHLISKLTETSELFISVNQDLIMREYMKRGVGNKGSWRSSKELREATRILERLIWFFKSLRLQPINNRQG